MTAYILRRLLQTVVVILLLSYFCYLLMTLMPGDPVDEMIMANPEITSADIDRLRALHGLDQPVWVRYWNWASSIATGDLGYSRTYRVPVTEILGPRLLNTFILAGAALLVALIVAIPLGVWAALRKNSTADYVINLFAFAGISVPSFWIAIVLILVFAVYIPLFPAGGTGSIAFDMTPWEAFVDRLKFLVLPVLSLSFLSIGTYVRYTRAAMLEAMGNDYIRTARAKGLSWPRIYLMHGFRNALIPLITITALSFSTLFSGAIITETVFAYQGVGQLVFESIQSNDFNVAMIAFMISVSMVLLMNLIADLLYGVADPRISYA
ncbi:MAG: ABC transporter permease [Gammaproteobacteria bacterium]|nr:MAG: ABC transporter permease [Gammaproteobacteria bacterium]